MSKNRNSILNGKILLEIGDSDYNKDGKLNDTDPEYLFVVNKDGSNFQKISPQNEDLQYFEVIPNSDEILLKTRRDINHDSIFNKMDESIWYKAKLVNNDWEVDEIIKAGQRKSIENLYFEQWLKKREFWISEH